MKKNIEPGNQGCWTMRNMPLRLLFLSCLLGSSSAFTTKPSDCNAVNRKTRSPLFSAVGGWGIGQSRELTDAEKAKGERRAFDGYQLRERGDFLQSIQDERKQMQKDEMEELLGVAKMAGIDVKPSSKFDKDLIDEDDENLDVSVQWEEEGGEANVDGESITRMDEDTGASGVW